MLFWLTCAQLPHGVFAELHPGSLSSNQNSCLGVNGTQCLPPATGWADQRGCREDRGLNVTHTHTTSGLMSECQRTTQKLSVLFEWLSMDIISHHIKGVLHQFYTLMSALRTWQVLLHKYSATKCYCQVLPRKKNALNKRPHYGYAALTSLSFLFFNSHCDSNNVEKYNTWHLYHIVFSNCI